ncbi:MAG TPA: hypothetical protein VFR46_03405 [Actinomycetes bacterium]|nr:hypothetical protein [Actinomycetes bacterium]
MAILGTIFFAALDDAFAASGQAAAVTPLESYSQALTVILPWQIACYLVAAALMLLLPSRAASVIPSSTPVLDEGK